MSYIATDFLLKCNIRRFTIIFWNIYESEQQIETIQLEHKLKLHLPAYLTPYINFSSDRSHSTRSPTQRHLEEPVCRTKVFQSSFLRYCIKTWNGLDPDLKIQTHIKNLRVKYCYLLTEYRIPSSQFTMCMVYKYTKIYRLHINKLLHLLLYGSKLYSFEINKEIIKLIIKFLKLSKRFERRLLWLVFPLPP